MPPRFTVRTCCPACDSSRRKELLRVPYDDSALVRAMERLYADVGRYDPAATAGASYVLVECVDCGLIFQVEVPAQELAQAIYGGWHDPAKTRARLRQAVNPERALRVAREVALAWRLAGVAGQPLRVLDYGCGLGQWASMAVAFGAETWGVELSPERREHCASMGVRMVDERELPRDYFDYVHLDQVIEHVSEPRALLASLRAHARPGGVICVAAPSARRVAARARAWREEFARPNFGALMPVEPLLHLNGFSHRSLRALGKRCELALERPAWRWLAMFWAPGSSLPALIKSWALPFYLRSPFATRLYFRKPAASIA